jgi:hypothetical protein
VIYIGFCFGFSDSTIIGFLYVWGDTIFFMLLHFYNIKIKNPMDGMTLFSGLLVSSAPGGGGGGV